MGIAPMAVLANGVEMPRSGFGTYQITDPDTCSQAVVDAITTGYRLIDTASSYFNERAVGAGIARAVERGAAAREELFVTTKVWVQDAGYSETHAAFKRSLAQLGLDYLDLCLIHQPLGDYYGSWRALEELLDAGLVRAIGVCNFDEERLADLCLSASVAPMVDQVEAHPFYQRPRLQQVMTEYGVQPESWATLAEGKNGLFAHPVLTEVGASYGKTAAQVALRWNAQRGAVVLAKSTNPGRMAQNLGIWDFELTDGEISRIAGLDEGKSLFDYGTAAGARARHAFKVHA